MSLLVLINLRSQEDGEYENTNTLKLLSIDKSVTKSQVNEYAIN